MCIPLTHLERLPANSESLIERLDSLSYSDRRQVLESPPNDFPLHLYKYLKSTVEDKILANYLINSCFFLSSPTEFNDPFDMSAYLTLSKDISKRIAKYKALVKCNRPETKWKQTNKLVSAFMQDPEKQLSTFKASVGRHIKNMGVMCFSQEHRNLLMWSHYADHHKGFVLEFDITHSVVPMLRVSKVEYSDVYPVLDYIEITNDQIGIVLLRKHVGWEYEREWRMVVANGANTYLEFKPRAVTGLIFGCRADQELKKKILSILERRASMNLSPVNVYSAVKHEREYQVAIQKDEFLDWPS